VLSNDKNCFRENQEGRAKLEGTDSSRLAQSKQFKHRLGKDAWPSKSVGLGKLLSWVVLPSGLPLAS
jgi:hypothetical protein